MTNESTVLVQLRISDEANSRMEAARAALQQSIALVNKGAFVTAAINHYARHLADEFNDGIDWLDQQPTVDEETIRTLADTRTFFVPTVDWVRLDKKRQPTDVELHRQLGGATMAVARLRTDNRDEVRPHHDGYRMLLRAAGLEIDPDRDEFTDGGYYFLPIRYRRRQEESKS